MIRAIIFDCFGVLVRDGWLPFVEEHFARNPAKLQEATDLNKSYDAGLTSYDNFIQGIADLAGISAQAANDTIKQRPINTSLFEYMQKQLHPNYKIGMLSNAGANWLTEMFTSEQLALFDATALSSELGVIKPNSAAYYAIADRLGVQPNECIFIDDQERYCTGATDVGMQALVFHDTPTLIDQLDNLLNSVN